MPGSHAEIEVHSKSSGNLARSEIVSFQIARPPLGCRTLAVFKGAGFFTCVTLSWPAGRKRALAIFALAGMFFPALARAQQTAAVNPETALFGALAAACKQDDATFANSLTSDNAAAYRALPGPQRTAVMKRFVLLEDPGRPLFSTSAAGRTIVRCETPAFTTEMRFGETRVRENLAYVPMDIPLPGESARSITFGMVREGGNWKLLSVGLILLD